MQLVALVKNLHLSHYQDDQMTSTQLQRETTSRELTRRTFAYHRDSNALLYPLQTASPDVVKVNTGQLLGRRKGVTKSLEEVSRSNLGITYTWYISHMHTIQHM